MAAVYRTPPQIASTNHTQLADIFGSPLGGDVAPVPRGVRLRPRGRRLTVPNVPRIIFMEETRSS
jgi:hypothetical protein